MDLDKRGKRARRALILGVVVLAFFGLFKWLTVATPVSEDAAIELFEDENRAQGPHRIAKRLKPEDATPDRQARKTSKKGDARSQPDPKRGVSPSGSGPIEEKMSSETVDLAVVPNEGVYEYETEGGESVSAYKFRNFPSRTYRSVIHTGSASWVERHTFISERQTWTAFRSEGASLVCDWARQYVEFGEGRHTFKFDERVDFDRPVRVLRLPWEVGRTWEGSFEDANGQNIYGTYTVTTGTRSRLDVGGESVEAWLEEVVLSIHGDYEGTIAVKRWTSPAYGVAVREETVADVQKGPLTYKADWTAQLSSLEPAR